MAVIFSGRGLVLAPSFRVRVEHKPARSGRLLHGPGDARAVCEAEKFRRIARLTVRARCHTLTGEAIAGDLLAVVDGTPDALRRQARETKERRRRSRSRAGRVA
ncbi:MAG TPA: HPF/RaiA family ribosome-associated protein [Methylomirabilota bacterium]|nr:HPF/RaiA family ribosome-associated protein [Methylomirabilota bacterium]